METTLGLLAKSQTGSHIKHNTLAATVFGQKEWRSDWGELCKPHAVLIKFIKNALSLSRFEGR